EPPFSVFTVLVVTLLVLLIAATFLWNLLVLVTILRVRAFHRVPHNLVASTAVSDVLVAVLVMPLSLVSELSAGRRWRLGRSLCHVWISFDVLCCTASIWNVAAIALDRYWTITRHLQYTLRTRRRASALMIALTWALSALIALAPLLFGWGEAYDARRQRCQVSQEPSYAVFSTCGAFYLPLGVVLFVYWKIYKAANSSHAKVQRGSGSHPAELSARQQLLALDPLPSLALQSGTTGFQGCRARGRDGWKYSSFYLPSPKADTCQLCPRPIGQPLAATSRRARGVVGEHRLCHQPSFSSWCNVLTARFLCSKVKEAPQEAEMVFTARRPVVAFQMSGDSWREQKEKRAAVMVGILIGVFVLCWIPFFLAELISPLCACSLPPIWKSIFLWLGYSNSFFNPLIYTAFNKNYNNAFRSLFSK
ncbi:hypothetical protein PANDA_011981, partial [Ailuropoda melanoleuca]